MKTDTDRFSDTYLESEDLIIRALESQDVMFCWEVEHDSSQWLCNGMQAPCSLRHIESFVKEYTAEPFAAGQIRMVLMRRNNPGPAEEHAIRFREYENYPGYENIGLVDLFGISAIHGNAQIGIYILPRFRGKGYGTQAVSILGKYAYDILNVRTLLAKVASPNKASIRMFEKSGYSKCGLLTDWLRIAGRPYDLLLYQKILTEK